MNEEKKLLHDASKSDTDRTGLSVRRSEAAKYLGLSLIGFSKLVGMKRIKEYRDTRKHRRYSVPELEAFYMQEYGKPREFKHIKHKRSPAGKRKPQSAKSFIKAIYYNANKIEREFAESNLHGDQNQSQPTIATPHGTNIHRTQLMRSKTIYAWSFEKLNESVHDVFIECQKNNWVVKDIKVMKGGMLRKHCAIVFYQKED